MLPAGCSAGVLCRDPSKGTEAAPDYVIHQIIDHTLPVFRMQEGLPPRALVRVFGEKDFCFGFRWGRRGEGPGGGGCQVGQVTECLPQW